MIDLHTIIPTDFNDNSRVWIYQSSKIFTLQEAFAIEDMPTQFITNWKSHGTPVKGYANLLFGQFIILLADETATGISGCSTDSSVHLMKEIEQRFKVDLFNRQHLAFYIKEKVQIIPMAQLSYALQNGFIDAETLYFNNVIADKKSLLNNWITPVKNTWLASKLNITV
ncbi:MAG: hypothetical protein K2X37_05820 [Chitinophagaceae bacterium]|nr:hypothetical protein [Chitinophagaceae bacterium]